MKKTLDWDALKSEWLAGSESLNAFRKSKGIVSTTHFYRMVERHRWEEAREKISAKTAQKVEGQLVEAAVVRWEEYLTVCADVLEQIKGVVKAAKGAQMSPAELNHLIAALERLVKVGSFLSGGPTERIEGQGVIFQKTSAHGTIVELLKATASGDPRFVLPGTVTDEDQLN